jgi:hypothetical protein
MIYGFILDDAFVPTNSNMLSIDSSIEHGYLKRELYSYFLKPNNIKDPRTTRLHLFTEPMTSKMELIWDVDESIVDPSLVSHIENSNDDYKACLFNIIEFLFYRTVSFTRDELNDELVNDNTQFSNYISDSLVISVKTNEVSIHDNAQTTCDIMEWVSFKIDINGHIVEFKLWINSTSFKDEYPLSHICEIVFPMSNSELLNPSTISNIYDAINKTFDISFNKLNYKINEGNHTGYKLFSTKYITPDGGLFELAFSVLYKGRIPTSLEIRNAIKSELDYYLADEAEWKTRLPDLFIDGRFYVIPIWDYQVEEPNRTTYPSIMSLKTMLDKTKEIMYEFDEEYIRDNLEIINVAYIESSIGILPDNENALDIGVRDRHPVYQYYGPHQASFNYQPPLTREFNRKLNEVLSAALGLSTISNLSVETIDDRNFLVFIVDGLEFLIITKTSYINTLGNIS